MEFDPMASSPPTLLGTLAAHPVAAAFAAEVQRVHRRYANEIVGAFRLCPFMKDADTAFGRFFVMIDRTLDVAAARDAVIGAKSSVVHLVYPRTLAEPTVFERFGSEVGQALRVAVRPAPVIASFHPRLAGDPCSAPRLVGVLRRAPDPFVQFVPEGLHEGGTVLAGVYPEPPPDPVQVNFERMQGGAIDRLLGALADIHADRERSYAPFLEALRQEV
jgi:hypothetical protein